MTEQERVPLIELRNVSKSFGRLEAIKNLNLKIFEGESLGLLAVLRLGGAKCVGNASRRGTSPAPSARTGTERIDSREPRTSGGG